MNKFKLMDSPNLWQWIEMEDNTEPEGIRERCTMDYISERFAEVKKSVEAKKNPQLKKMEIVAVEIYDQGTYEEPGMPPTGDLPSFCKVTLDSAIEGGRIAKIKVFLPLVWNGRLFGHPGGGLRMEMPFGWGEGVGGLDMYDVPSVARTLRNHGAGVVTDGSVKDNTWGFKKGTDELEWDLFMHWAFLGTHQMTAVAKVMCQIVYGEGPEYSYIFGASAGGRHTMSYVELFPQDYDGALPLCPAAPWFGHIISEGWAYFVLNNENYKMPRAKLDEMQEAILEKYGCTDKGYVDCAHTIDFDFFSLIGRETAAGPFTQRDAEILKKIYDGPHYTDGRKMPGCDRIDPMVKFWRADLWLGLIPIEEDGSFSDFYVDRMGTIRQVLSWAARDPELRLEDITLEDLDWLYDKGMSEFKFLEGQGIDLRGFKEKGGKVIYTMSTTDGMSPHAMSRKYFESVNRFFGKETDEFFKFYYVYGGAHTLVADYVRGNQLALGPACKALMKWVEEGVAPDELETIAWDHEKNEPGFGPYALPYTLDDPN